MKMSWSSNFTAHKREACALASVLVMGTCSIYCMTKESDIELAECCFVRFIKSEMVITEIHYEDSAATSKYSSLRNHLLYSLLNVTGKLYQVDAFKRNT